MSLLSLAIVLVALATMATALRTPLQGSSRRMSLLQQASEQSFFEKFAAMFDFKLPKGLGSDTSTTTKSIPPPPVPPVIEDATLVFGATGKAGTRIVDAILKSKRQVIVAARSAKTAEAKFSAEYLKKYEKSLFIRSGVDVTDPATMTEGLFAGVTQVVTSLGPVFGPGGVGLTSEAVDYRGGLNVIDGVKKYIKPEAGAAATKPLVQFDVANRKLEQWSRLDDVLMGGASSSAWTAVQWGGEGAEFCRWSGNVVTDGGGFCGTVIKDMKFDATGFDGVSILLRGDGNRFKFRLKPDTVAGTKNEFQYQAVFQTRKGQWMEVKLPFENFVSVRRNDVAYGEPEVHLAARGEGNGKMASVGLVLSRFDFNEMPNPTTEAGEFALDVSSINLYRNARPAVVMVSSAGTERIQKLSAEQCKRDIPIVALNPIGILNWKYKGEEALRLSGLPYSIIRATGLVNAPTPNSDPAAAAAAAAADPDSQKDVTMLRSKRRLEASQGDSTVGRITREELADIVSASLDSAHSVGKTFEVRRDETESGALCDPVAGVVNNFGHKFGGGVYDFETNYNRLFAGLVRDDDRILGGASSFLPPFPASTLPLDAPIDKEAILNDPRVKAVAARDAKERRDMGIDKEEEVKEEVKEVKV